ncbi:MAG: MOSC domain-containing protein [Pseudomonadales bacterium]
MIKSIYVAAKHGDPLTSVKQIELIAGKGIVGDRNFAQSEWPGQNLTLIEREQVDAFNQNHQRSIDESDPRRTVVTQNVDLNSLVGKEFAIGSVRLLGVELCEPCKGIGEQLATDTMTGPEVVKAFVHKAGLRTDVLCDGVIEVGMSVDA